MGNELSSTVGRGIYKLQRACGEVSHEEEDQSETRMHRREQNYENERGGKVNKSKNKNKIFSPLTPTYSHAQGEHDLFEHPPKSDILPHDDKGVSDEHEDEDADEDG